MKDCEKDSHKEGWKYCGESDCASCGGGVKKSFEVAWELMKSEGRSFRLNFGPKNLYLVIEYDDGKELFMQDYDSFLEEFRQVEAMADEDYLEMMYGVGSEYHGIAQRPEDVGKSDEKGDNAPTNPGLWAQAKSKARSKFKVYPSAYANGWAAKWYKSKGGGWKKKGKKVKKSDDFDWDELEISMQGEYNRDRQEAGDIMERFSLGSHNVPLPVGSELPIPGQRLMIYSKGRPEAFGSRDYMVGRYIGPERIGNHGVLLKVKILEDRDEYQTQGNEDEGLTGQTILVDPRLQMVIVQDMHGNERVIR